MRRNRNYMLKLILAEFRQPENSPHSDALYCEVGFQASGTAATDSGAFLLLVLGDSALSRSSSAPGAPVIVEKTALRSGLGKVSAVTLEIYSIAWLTADIEHQHIVRYRSL